MKGFPSLPSRAITAELGSITNIKMRETHLEREYNR